MQNILTAIAVSLLLGVNWLITANAIDFDRTPIPPVVYDLEGNMLEQVTVGHQVIISKTFVNDMNFSQPFVALFEVRDSRGVSVYVAWQNTTMAASSQLNVGISWMADNIDIYEIRTFAVTNMTNPAVIDTVETAEMPVVEALNS